MSQSTNSKHTEQLNTQLNANETHKQRYGKPIVSREPIEGTPFTIAKNEKGYTLLLGLYALTPTFKTKKQLNEYRNKNEWNLIVNTLHAMLDFHKLINQEKNQTT